jgi:hypothetical protein
MKTKLEIMQFILNVIAEVDTPPRFYVSDFCRAFGLPISRVQNKKL